MALNLAHYLGPLADLTDLGPWLAQFRDELLNLSERYWSGLFHCYGSRCHNCPEVGAISYCEGALVRLY